MESPASRPRGRPFKKPTAQSKVRINVVFSAEAADWLEQEAERRATSMAEVVRRIVDETRGAFIVHR